MNKKNRMALQAVVLLALAASWVEARELTVEADKLRQSLYSTCFVTEDEGWAVGDLGRIFHTTNGALTWHLQDSGTKRPFVSIACIDNQRLWAAGQVGQVSRTTDGGKTWTMLDSGTDVQLLDIHFADANTGIVIGDRGLIRRTTDGGVSWTTIPVPEDTQLPPDIAEIVPPGDVVLYAVHFADTQHVWVAGEFGVILKSNDGGQTFVSQSSGVESTLFGINFVDDQRGWAVGMEAVMLSTSDGGDTWTREQIDTPTGFALSIYDVNVDRSSNIGWAVGANGFMLSSADTGRTWQRAPVPVQLGSSWFRGVSVLPDGRGFAVGSNGMVVSLDRLNLKILKERY